ncbi:MAG: sulfatase-like hydrolase/transferase [Limisphaerales bacterium]
MKHYHLLILVALMLELAGLARAESLTAIFTNVAPAAQVVLPRRPNIILIATHGLGYGDLSSYGQAKFQTPNLDRMAANGIRFTNYSAGGVASSPVRAALLTGMEPGQLKQREEVNVPLASDEITIAQLLKNSGYHTGLIGEWDLGSDGTSGAPWNKGFDEFAGYFDPADAENYYADYIWRYAPKSFLNETNNQLEDYIGREMLYANIDGKRGQYIPDLYTKAAMNFIVNNQPDQFNRHRPFFLLLNYATPRVNLAETIRIGNGMQVPTDAPFSSESWPQTEKNRAAMIARLDGDIGKLLAKLQSIRQDSNTVVFFTSVGLPKKTGGVDPQFFRSVLSTNDLRAPMIVNWPGKIPAGQVSAFKWSSRDCSADSRPDRHGEFADQSRRGFDFAGAAWRVVDQFVREELIINAPDCCWAAVR